MPTGGVWFGSADCDGVTWARSALRFASFFWIMAESLEATAGEGLGATGAAGAGTPGAGTGPGVGDKFDGGIDGVEGPLSAPGVLGFAPEPGFESWIWSIFFLSDSSIRLISSVVQPSACKP